MASGVISKQYLYEEILISSGTISASSTEALAKNVAKVGYKPIGIIQIRKSGQNYANVAISGYYIDDASSEARIAILNTTTSSRTYNVYATILYEKV